MSDATGKDLNTSPVREIDSEGKIAALKERIAKGHSGIVVNGTNGRSKHSENTKSVKNQSDNMLNIRTANGLNSEVDNGNSTLNSEKGLKVSSNLQHHTNGKMSTSSLPVKTSKTVFNSKLPLPAGMSVTPLGNYYVVKNSVRYQIMNIPGVY